jgi:hypothetical protein
MLYYLLILSFLLNIIIYESINLNTILVLITITLATAFLLTNSKKSISIQYLIMAFAVLLYSTYLSIDNFVNDTPIVNGYFWWLILPAVLFVFPVPTHNLLRRITHLYFIGSIIVIAFDAWYRIIYSPLGSPLSFLLDLEGFNRYSYKFGIIGMDSNFAGIYAMLSLFFLIYLEHIYQIKLFYYKVLYIILVLLSFSIASILVSFYFLILFKLNQYNKIAFILFTILLSPLILYFISLDGSGLTKIKLFFDFTDNINDIPTLLLGNGLNAVIIGEIPPHNIFIKLLTETGLFGLIMYLLMIWSIFQLIGRRFYFIAFPFFLVGLSVVNTSYSILTLLIILMYYHENQTCARATLDRVEK